MINRALWAVCDDEDVHIAAINCATRLALSPTGETLAVVGFVLFCGAEVRADMYDGPLENISSAVVAVPQAPYIMLELDDFTGVCGNA